MSNWRPIDSAPKDGTYIIVCQAVAADGKPIIGPAFGLFCQVAAWWAEENDGEGDWIVYCSIPSDPSLHFEPTHWQPMLPPPMLRKPDFIDQNGDGWFSAPVRWDYPG